MKEEINNSRRLFISSLICIYCFLFTDMTLIVEGGLVISSQGVTKSTQNRKDITRQRFLSSTLSKASVLVLPLIMSPLPNNAEPMSVGNMEQNVKVVFGGEISLQPGATIPDDISLSALYITARPNNPVDVPRAILDGSNGKPPPVLAARFVNIKFPFNFELKTSDLTVEGNSRISSDDGYYWWEKSDLIVSARFDTDGIAATRDPSDLVGRNMYISGKDDTVTIELQGRGIAGKFFTTKK